MPRKTRAVLLALFLQVSLTLSLTAGCTTDTAAISEPVLGLDVVEEAWQIIFEEYVEKDSLDASVLSEAAIKGMVEALNDPYSSYLNADNYQLSTSDLQGTFEGIGAYVGIRDGQLIIISPMPDSPAKGAGIKAGDVILEVEGSPTSEMSLEEAVLRIRGPKGTPIKLLILHVDETEPEEIEIIRGSIQVPSIIFEMRDDIAYIRIYSFSQRTDEELGKALEDINEEETTSGLILDVRSNPGGLLGVVVDVTSHFLEEGIVVSVVDNEGGEETLAVNRQNVMTDLPIVILSDNFSASGSEVLIGALQDHGRATVAGTKTFGKGSVNILNRLKDGSGLYITIARWYTPNGRLIEGEGIEPDHILDLEVEDTIKWAIDYLKDNK
jgi:carboxyl-terminal processing protease